MPTPTIVFDCMFDSYNDLDILSICTISIEFIPLKHVRYKVDINYPLSPTDRDQTTLTYNVSYFMWLVASIQISLAML